MPLSPSKLHSEARVRMVDLEANLRKMRTRLAGRGGVSQYDRPELHPGYDQLVRHLERAIVWAEELNYLIETELS